MTKVVLGGGLSGLSAAYYLTKLNKGKKIVLLEASSRLGGHIKSAKVDGQVIFEQAARTIRPAGTAGINTLNLLDELNLNADIIPISRNSVVAKNRLIYANKELHKLPNSPLTVLTTQKPFSKPLFMQVLQDLITKSKIMPDDSAYEFTKRRFGIEIADYLVDTVICGICGGNSKEVSVNFLMKSLFDYEQKYDSVLLGILINLFSKQKEPTKLGRLALKAKLERWNVYIFKDGMETLPVALKGALHSAGNTDIQLNAECNDILFKEDGGIFIQLQDGRKLESSHVISSIPAIKLAPLVQKQHPELANKLAKVKTVTISVINLFYKGDLIKIPAFGFLVPPKEKLPILGVIYDSCSRTYKDKTVLTVMMGGYWFNELFGDNPTEEMLLKIATDNLKTILGITEKPDQYKVNILRDAIPQYLVGHLKNLDEINSYIKEKELPLSLCGVSYHGVGVNDVILSAKKVAENLV